MNDGKLPRHLTTANIVSGIIVLFYLTIVMFSSLRPVGLQFDEPCILDPSIQFAKEGIMSFPSAGPGAGHELAHFYQVPLNYWLLGFWFKIFGISIAAAHAYSIFIGLLILLLVLSVYRRLFGAFFAIVCSLILLAEPSFAARMIIVRYDGIPYLFTLSAIALVLRRDGFVKDWQYWLGAGCAMGIAISAHILFAIYGIGLALSFVMTQRKTKAATLGKCLFALSFGFLLLFSPVIIYIALHYEAFKEQFLYQFLQQRTRNAGFIESEILKYTHYFYRRQGYLLLLATGLLWCIIRSVKGNSKLPLFELFLLIIFVGFSLTFASGGKFWHVSTMAPIFALLISAAITDARKVASEPNRWKHSALFVIFIGIVGTSNGLVLGPVRMALQSHLERSTKNLEMLEEYMAGFIPPKSRVFGAQDLILLAERRNWTFVADYGNMFNSDPIAEMSPQFDFVVIKSAMGKSPQPPPVGFFKIATYSERQTITDLLRNQSIWYKRFFYPNGPIDYVIYANDNYDK